MKDYHKDARFAGIESFDGKVWLATPTMHGDEQKWVDEAIRTNWVSTVGANINEVERLTCGKIGCGYAVGLIHFHLSHDKARLFCKRQASLRRSPCRGPSQHRSR